MPSERSRHLLYEDLKGVISVESADELMAYLPPVGWADVATKSDLAMIRVEMDALRAEMLGELRGGLAELKSDLQRWVVTTLIAMTGLFGAIVFAAVRLNG